MSFGAGAGARRHGIRLGPLHLEDVKIGSADGRGRPGEQRGAVRPPGEARPTGQDRRRPVDGCDEHARHMMERLSAAHVP